MRDALYPIYRKVARSLGRTRVARLPVLRALHRRLRSSLTSGAVPVMGHQMLIDRPDTLELASRGVHDPLETHVLVHHARPGDVVVDLGAHIGYFTLLLARRVGPEGHVYAFEPDPENLRLLRRNVRLNGYRNVTCVGSAVGERTGTTTLFRAPENLGDHRTADPQEPGRERLEVGVTRLDDYLRGRTDHVDLVKLDVQGAEAAALEGMGDLLTRDRPTIVLEFWPPGLRRAGAEPTAVLERLVALGYALHHLDEIADRVAPVGDVRTFARPFEAAEIYSPNRDDYASVLCIPPGGPEVRRDGSPAAGAIEWDRDVGGLQGHLLPPSGAALFVELAYAALLGRPVDDATRERTCLRLARGETTRHRVLLDLVESHEFRDAALLEEILVETRDADPPFELENGPRWPGTTERVVEVPWVLTRYRGERRVLDVGYAFAEAVYLTGLLALGIPELHGLDLAARRVPGLHGTIGDGRSLPFRDESFELVLCVSTLEHIGRDNARYGVEAPEEPGGDARFLQDVGRVLSPGGRLLVTVPVGRFEDHDWFVQYDLDSWTSLLERSPLTAEEQSIFELTGEGWIRTADHERIAKLSYAEDARGARAVLCSALRRP